MGEERGLGVVDGSVICDPLAVCVDVGGRSGREGFGEIRVGSQGPIC